MSAARKHSLGIVTGLLLIVALLIVEAIGGESLGTGKSLGAALGESVGLRSLIYYENGRYEGAFYFRSGGGYRKVLGVDPLTPPLFCSSIAIAILIAYLAVVYKLHRFLAAATADSHPVKPAKAVWGHLLPIYSFYWVFEWTNRAAEFVSHRDADAGKWKGWPGLVLLVGFLAAGADVVIGMSIVMLMLARIRSRVVAVLQSQVLMEQSR